MANISLQFEKCENRSDRADRARKRDQSHISEEVEDEKEPSPTL